MIINNVGNVFQLCISTKRKQKLHNLQRSKWKPVQIKMCVVFHINDILNDSWKLIMQVNEKASQVWEWNKYSKSIAAQLFYQHTPIDTSIYKYFVCCKCKTKYTDWMSHTKWRWVGHLFTYVKPGKDDRVIIESQCICIWYIIIYMPLHLLCLNCCHDLGRLP